jgi:hypothetical protein
MNLRGRWWNRRWETGRRDIWLYAHDGSWLVTAKDGAGVAGRELTWPAFEQEWQARAWVDRLMTTAPGGRADWKDMTKLVGGQPDRAG